MRHPLAATLVLLVVLACAGASEKNAGESPWALDTVFHLANPAYLFALDGGGFAALQDDPARIVIFDSTGDSVRAFGRGGRGPGEFLMPRGLVLHGDTLQVLDIGNLRLVSFRLDGTPVATRPIPAAVAGNMFMLFGGDTLLISTQGQHEALAVRQTLDGPILHRYGHPRSPAVTFYMMGDIARTIASGRVPDEMKNETLPIHGCDGEEWLVEQANGLVGRYSIDGSDRGTFHLPPAYVEQRKAAFFELNRQAKPNMFYSLRMVSDAVAAPGGLWLALVTPDSLPPRLLFLDSLARVGADFEISGLRGNVGFVKGANTCGELLLHHYDTGVVLRARRTSP